MNAAEVGVLVDIVGMIAGMTMLSGFAVSWLWFRE